MDQESRYDYIISLLIDFGFSISERVSLSSEQCEIITFEGFNVEVAIVNYLSLSPTPGSLRVEFADEEGYLISFEQFIEKIPSNIKKKFLYHLELFI